MSPPAQSWADRARNIDDERAEHKATPKDQRTQVIRFLKVVADHGCCSPEVVGWLKEERSSGGRTQITWSQNADGTDSSGHRAVTLNSLPSLKDGAILTISIEFDRSNLRSYSVGLQGILRERDSRWYTRIDLDPEQRGSGPCSHPRLHCHVGLDPDDRDEPAVRVALPWLTPLEALEWILASADPERMEPQHHLSR